MMCSAAGRWRWIHCPIYSDILGLIRHLPARDAPADPRPEAWRSINTPTNLITVTDFDTPSTFDITNDHGSRNQYWPTCLQQPQ